jgi:hypothetical protein
MDIVQLQNEKASLERQLENSRNNEEILKRLEKVDEDILIYETALNFLKY